MREVPEPEDNDYYDDLLANSWTSFDEEDELDLAFADDYSDQFPDEEYDPDYELEGEDPLTEE